MKVSGFTFLRNGQRPGCPFVASIRSILPLVDEFVIAPGPCDDDTEKMLHDIGSLNDQLISHEKKTSLDDEAGKGFACGSTRNLAGWCFIH